MNDKSILKPPLNKYLQLLLLFFVGVVLLCYPQKSMAQSLNEEELKTAYLFNFSKYITWSNEAQRSTFTIGVYGQNAPNDIILSQMAEIYNQRLTERYFIIKHFYKGSPVDNVEILYIPEITRSEQIELLNELKNQPHILTVGNKLPHFCEDGGMINFLPMTEEAPFAINQSRARAAGLKINPKLLKLANICQ